MGLQRADAGAEVSVHELHDGPFVERAPFDVERRHVVREADVGSPGAQLGERRLDVRRLHGDLGAVDIADERRAAASADEEQGDRVTPGAKGRNDRSQVGFNAALGVKRVLGDEDLHARTPAGVNTTCPSRANNSAPGSSGAACSPSNAIVSRA